MYDESSNVGRRWLFSKRARTMSETTRPAPNPRRSYGLFSRLTRRWTVILALWVLICTPVVFLIHRLVEPTFEAVSVLRVTPESGGLFETTSSEDLDFSRVVPYLQTQVTLITSDRVLGVAIANPEVARLSTITETADPRAVLREKMSVGIVQDAYLIRVALALPDPNQAAAIVNAVVGSYLAYNGEHSRSANSKLRQSLVAQLEKYKTAINDKRAELKALQHKNAVDVHGANAPNESGKAIDPTRPSLAAVTPEQAKRIMDELIDSDMELIKAQSLLDVTQGDGKGVDDPAVRKTLNALQQNLAAILKQREYQAKYIHSMKVQTQSDNRDTFDTDFANRQLDTLLKREDQVKANLEQLEFASSREDYRVNTVDGAVAPKIPTNNDRLHYMAVAPIAVLLALIALALISPIREERA